MRDPVNSPPRDTNRAPVDDPARGRRSAGGASRWIWIGAAVLLGLVLLFWLFGMGDDTADVVDVTPSATLPADEVVADPDAEVVEIQPTTDADPEVDVEVETDTVPSTPPE